MTGLSIPIDPVGKPRMTQRDVWKQRPAVMKYRAFCDELRFHMTEEYVLPVELHLTFFIAMPKSWSKAKRQLNLGRPHDAKPDIDNLAKGYMDAFKTEDKHVAVLHAEKYWAEYGSIEVAQ